MSRRRRLIVSNQLYEIGFRARNSLPFVCTEYLRLIVLSALARVQRDNKLIIHHFIFEGSHPHFFCTAKDANRCQEFYGQLQKQITDSIKKLLGIEQLNIWEGRASVIRIPSLDDAILKIAYLYSNPSNDDLESAIELYPGISSWEAFSRSDSIDSIDSVECPWIRQPMIPKLPCRSLTSAQDSHFCEKMLSRVKKSHLLTVYPHQWIAHFIDNPTVEDVAQVRGRIIDCLRAKEAENARRREKDHLEVLGADKLKAQPILKAHRPKKTSIKIFVQSIFPELRKQIIDEMNYIEGLCREVYNKWKSGDFTALWPPGTFPPPLPPQANALCW